MNHDWIRQQFPALDGNAPYIHAENAGGSYLCSPVIERFEHYLENLRVQPGHPWPIAGEAQRAMEHSRQQLAAWLKSDVSQIRLGPSTTANTFVLAQAMAPNWCAGDNIIVSEQDHEANIGAWLRAAESRGVEVRWWRVDQESGLLDPATGQALIDERTRLLAATACSNIVGQHNRLESVAQTAHLAGALVVIDAVAWAPHLTLDPAASGADIYLFSLYKVFGPHQGLMWVAPGTDARLHNQSHNFLNSYPEKRLNPTGPDHAQVAASGGLVDYLDALAEQGITAEQLRTHENALCETILDVLRDHRSVRIIGQPAVNTHRAPTISFVVADQSSAAISQALGEQKIGCGHGHFYAPRLVRAMGIDPDDGVVRLSLTHYNSQDEGRRIAEALAHTLAKMSP
ncbi:aminotransferase class V-fold PLP-dependent enzyme [Gammaproteobacteria bacterium]|nr:aminotransferase class V-fold PLP-dependent enzyme [Gammaproteobacteria bacterium]